MASSPAHAACADPAGDEGSVVYNQTSKVVQFCDGTNWIAMGGSAIDARIGTLTANKWCVSNAGGTGIVCDQNAPTGAPSSGAAGLIQFSNGSGGFSSDSTALGQFLWDSSAHRLGLGTVTPESLLHVGSGGYAQFSKTFAGVPTGTDCDAAAELGRVTYDTTGAVFYFCKGAAGWAAVGNDGAGITALTGDVTGSGSGSVATTIANSAVTYAKIQNVSATSRLLGRYTAGAGVVEELSLGSGLSIVGGALTASVASETDPEVGALTGSKWCASNAGGTAIVCDQNAPTGAPSSGTAGFVQFSGGSGAFSSDNTALGQFFWDSANHRLGLGTTTPESLLHVGSGGYAQFSKTFAGVPTGTDCDAAAELGRVTYDTTGAVFYFCKGAAGWAAVGNDGAGITALTGDVTGSGTGSVATTIANSAVTYAKIQNVSATSRLLGRYSAGAGVVEELSLGSGLSIVGGALTASVASETDPQVGTLTNSKWCTTDGTSVNCTSNAPVLAEVDPKVGTLTNSKWCAANAGGTAIVCDQNAPTGAPSSGTAGFVQFSGGSGAFSSDNTALGQFFWDSANHRLGLGTTTPESLLHVGSGGYAQFSKTFAGVPTATDCDAAAEAGRVTYDTTNNLWFVCEGVGGWTPVGQGDGGITQLTGDVTAGPGSGSQAATIAANAVTTTKIADANVTYAKIQNVSATSRLLGRYSAGAGVVEELSLGSGLSIVGGALTASITETDPEVGALTNSKWCAANAGGTAIICDQNAPTTSAAGGDREIQFNNSGAFGASSTFKLMADGDLLLTGTYTGTASVPASGAGTRMFFDTQKAAFRAGYTSSSHWDNASIGSYSTAFGFSNIASGSYSAAFGEANTASGGGSTTFGSANTASASYSTAFGSYNTAGGNHSLALGYKVNVTSSGDGSVGFGLTTTSPATDPQVSGAQSFGIFMGNHSSVNFSAANTMGLFGGKLVIDPAIPATNLTADTSFETSGTIKIGSGAEACDAAHEGAIQYLAASDKFQLCATAGSWVDIATGSGGITQLTGDVTAGPGSGSQAATIANSAVTYAKIQNVSATSRLLGRYSAGAGVIEELSLGSGLSIVGGALTASITETDPEVGALTGSKWCASNAGGTAIVCDQDAPSSGSFPLLANPTGTASAPAYSFNADSNTGMFSDTADTVEFTAGGTEVLELGTAASGVNYFRMIPGATSVAPTLTNAGSDVSGNGLGMILSARGSGGSGAGGNISLTTGGGVGTSTGSYITLSGATAIGSGGPLYLSGGNSNSGAPNKNGGAVDIRGGQGVSSGASTGGMVTIYGGSGVTGGGVLVQGGAPSAGSGGPVSIVGAAGVGTNQSGGDVTITAGNETGSGTAGLVDITSGLRFSGDVSATSLSADQNDYNPTNLGRNAVLRLTASSPVNITGLAGGSDGRVLTIMNIGANAITLKGSVRSFV